MRALERINQDSQEQHQALQAWAMGIKPYRRYRGAAGVLPWPQDQRQRGDQPMKFREPK